MFSKWYKRNELCLRNGLLANLITFLSVFNVLIAIAILEGLNGKLGRAGWRWLFFITGGVTILFSLCAMFFLPDYPSTTRWLSDTNRRLAMKRMEEDAGVDDETETEVTGLATGFLMAIKDWRVWWLTVATMSSSAGMGVVSYTLTLIATMGHKPIVTLLLNVPPIVFSSIIGILLTRSVCACYARVT